MRTWGASPACPGFGTPGAASGVRTLSVEAVQELQILIAPFDVRYGNFAGGLVNAVTRSGSNRWEGSVTSYFQDQSLTGHDSAGNRAVDFSTKELTRDPGRADRPRPRRVLSRRRPAAIRRSPRRLRSAPTPPAAPTRSSSASAGPTRCASRTFSGTPTTWIPGSIEQVPVRDPAGNLFAKVSLWPALNQRIELSHNYAHGTLARARALRSATVATPCRP